MRIGIATDHGGFELKETLAARLRDTGHQVVDFGLEVGNHFGERSHQRRLT